MINDSFDVELFYKNPDPWHVQRRSAKNKRRESVLQNLSALYQDKNVLELGCGEGHLSQILAPVSRTLTGIDISKTAIARAREREIPNATFVVGSMIEPALYRGFDVVVLVEAIYYLSPEDQSIVLSAIRNLAATLLISAPVIGADEHRKYYTRQALVELLTSHGFRIEQERAISLHAKGGSMERLAIRAFKLLYFVLPAAVMDPIHDALPERWSYQILFVCR